LIVKRRKVLCDFVFASYVCAAPVPASIKTGTLL
jgi:hypothetical protein